MTAPSTPELKVLHAVRIQGFATTDAIAHRYDLDLATTRQHLHDAEGHGWIGYSSFADQAGWSLTEPGRRRNEQQLRDELDATQCVEQVRAAYRQFLPLNSYFQQTCTDWQIRPGPGLPLATNDHTDPDWDEGVLRQLSTCGRGLKPVAERLTAVLARFDGYDARYDTALRHIRSGDTHWVDSTTLDSCHHIIFELHEDLLASLNISRGSAS